MEEGYSRELALFERSIEDRGVQSRSYVEFQPSVPIAEATALEFRYSGNTSDYIDLSRTRLHLKFKIVNNDGDTVTSSDNVTVINFPLQSLWSQVDIALQNQIITSGTNNLYAFKSYIDAIVKSKADDEDILLPSQLFYKDTTGAMDGSPLVADNVELNAGASERLIFTSKGVVDLIGPLYIDLAQQERLILNAVPIHVKMWPNPDAFRLIDYSTEQNYKLTIVEAKLNLCLVKLYPSVVLGHAAALKQTPAIYEYDRSIMQSYQISKDSYSFSQDNLFQGLIPTSIIVALVSSQAFSGHRKKNPFNFAHYNVKSIGFYIDGQSVPHSKPMELDFVKNNFLEGYNSLHDDNDDGLKLDRESFAQGYALFKFSLDSRYNKKLAIPVKHGLTRLEIVFCMPVIEPVTVIVYASHPSLLQIDSARNVLL